MKKILTSLLLFCFFTNLNFAQSELGCDGVRYIEDVFSDIKKTTLTYGENMTASGSNQVLKMDIYEPENDDAEMRPVIILAFGGSFIFGQRNDMKAYCEAFARKGYVAATIDYRLYPLILGLPDSLEMTDEVVKAVSDMKASVRHFRMDAATDNTFKVDPNNIFVGGLSAGAITALHTAYLDLGDDVPQYVLDALDANGGIDGDTGSDDNKSYSSEVTGVLNLSGGLQSAGLISAGEVPLVSIHGTNDGTVPYASGIANGILYIEGSSILHTQAEAVGIDNYFKSVQGGGHTNFYIDPAFGADMTEFYLNMFGFFHEIICPDVQVSANQIDLSAQVKVFPNPSFDKIEINFEGIHSNYDIVVYDQLGRMISFANNQTDSIFILEKDEIGDGMYFVNVLFEDAEIAPLTKRVIFR